MFPVIAWYDIISGISVPPNKRLLFPVIAWYDIITGQRKMQGGWLLFPVIAWYDIIGNEKSPCLYMFTGIFHLKKS